MLSSYRVSTPTKDIPSPVMKDYSILKDFLGNYNPTQVASWNDFLLSDKQSECQFSHQVHMTVQQYIDTILSQYKNFSLQTLNRLSEKQKRLLTDMLLRMNLEKLQEHFGDYILYFLIFEAYPYDRYESYLKMYCEKKLSSVVKYGWDRFDMLRNASRRLRMQKMSFVDYMQLLKIFMMLRDGSCESAYKDILQKYKINDIDMSDISIESLSPRTTMPYGYTKYGDIWENDINKNEERAKDCYLDAPLTLCLCYKGEQVAIIAGMLRHHDTFVIHQMQTISSRVFTNAGVTKPKVTHPIIHRLARQDILFECMKSVIDSAGIANLYIQPGDMNAWTKEMHKIELWSRERNQVISETNTDVPHLSKEIAHKIYDVFAQKKGFTQDSLGFWEKKKIQSAKKKKTSITSKRLSSTA